jgi:hypothetical protein
LQRSHLPVDIETPLLQLISSDAGIALNCAAQKTDKCIFYIISIYYVLPGLVLDMNIGSG